MLDQQTIDEFVAFLSLGEKMEYNTRNILLRLSKYEADVPIEYFTADQFIGMFEKEGWVRFNHFKNIKSVIKKYILWRMYTDPDPLLSIKAIQAVHFAALDPTENFKRDYFGSFEDFYGFLTSLCGPCGDEEDPNLMFKVACSLLWLGLDLEEVECLPLGSVDRVNEILTIGDYVVAVPPPLLELFQRASGATAVRVISASGKERRYPYCETGAIYKVVARKDNIVRTGGDSKNRQERLRRKYRQLKTMASPEECGMKKELKIQGIQFSGMACRYRSYKTANKITGNTPKKIPQALLDDVARIFRIHLTKQSLETVLKKYEGWESTFYPQ